VQADAPPEDSPLAEEPLAWYRTLDATGGCFSERFRCVLDDQAVLDRETGLVWQRTPFAVSFNRQWSEAIRLCTDTEIGARGGWRLPTAEEFATVYLSTNPSPGLPPGHPFGGLIEYNLFWTLFWTRSLLGTTVGSIAVLTYQFLGGFEDFGGSAYENDLFETHRVWCVRAPAVSGEYW